MNSKPKPLESHLGDMIDEIAKGRPEIVRAAYYREMMYCRSLPQDDEMLRILRILQILTLLMDQIPSRVAVEREKLERLFTEALQVLKEALSTGTRYQKQLDDRLAQLPERIGKGISPETIAASINENLRQQFARSTIPETAQALALAADKMKHATAEFGATASDLGKSYRGAAAEARQAIDNINTSVSRAAGSAKRAVEELSVNFRDAYWWAIYGLTSAALVVGFLLGMVFLQWFDSPVRPAVGQFTAPVSQAAPDLKPKVKPSR
jgi:type I site-specific restriction endonuclease